MLATAETGFIGYHPAALPKNRGRHPVFRAASACTKRFRYSSITSVRAYETLSETNFGIAPTELSFRPNLYVDISDHLDAKLDTLSLYVGETGDHPFPRSAEAVEALARLRGSEAGVPAAEAFMILREVHL